MHTVYIPVWYRRVIGMSSKRGADPSQLPNNPFGHERVLERREERGEAREEKRGERGERRGERK